MVPRLGGVSGAPVGGRGTATPSVGDGPQAVLFDMDGTLVETEEYWGQAMFELAASLGGQMSPEARAATVGTSMRRAMEVLHADLGLAPTEAQLQADGDRVENRVAELMAGSGIPWRPGARELLAAVRDAGTATALVTTTARRLAALVLAGIAADLGADPFHVTVCGDEVPARKPDPSPYLQAAASLGVDPTGCVVVEDSLVGVTAGLAAGMAVLGVPVLQTLPPAPGLTLRETLAGVGLADLAEVLAAR